MVGGGQWGSHRRCQTRIALFISLALITLRQAIWGTDGGRKFAGATISGSQLIGSSLIVSSNAQPNSLTDRYGGVRDIYDFKIKDIYGKPIHLSDFQEKLIIFVNMASRNGIAQEEYGILNDIYEKYHDFGLEIFAFPCDNFSNCPDGDEYLVEFHEDMMKAKFPLTEKISVNENNFDEVGENTSPPEVHPLYNFLKDHTDKQPVKWDFLTKFVVLPGGRIWRFNDRIAYRTMTFEQFIRRKWGIDSDSTATSLRAESTDSDDDGRTARDGMDEREEEEEGHRRVHHRKVEDAGAKFPLYEGISLQAEVGKDYGDPLLAKMIRHGRWPFNKPK